MRLIDADALVKHCNGNPFITDSVKSYVQISVATMPTIEERKTGKWIRETKHYKDSEQEFYYYEERCSECGTKRKIGWAGVRYCPMCGTMVQEGEDNGTAD